ncbi:MULTISPECIES: amino acid ABC transporter substrate-binding protein [unclassified Uliginosibacterium]|uniref:amino acid ABC transporter substrate-binding protein n=1 Tax=unclassified Uliginosibacterium TaxID=2621521 RepID=UPI000C7C86F9|nr:MULTISPECIES: amino acid ABC transporter substrate-binding protein [unclassified Uliginosibacterium]MDO6385181.1 amino acid ABC transporter substrate-binding protein [Uliginosibacterium sp. 31-12]PLK48853.1 amino acid ABC transporter substrate-binding protein [Uliginosibacterium sp. TH139]
MHGISLRRLSLTLPLLIASLLATPAHAGKTLDAIKARGNIQCGVSTGVAGFSLPDSQGNWSGFDVDLCRGIAAAVLGDANKVSFVPLNSQQRFSAIQSGEVDVLARNTTWTLNRDASLGLNFTGVTYYDGQGFLVPKKLKVTSAKQLKNAEVCVQSGTTNEKNLADYFRSQGIKIKPVVFEGFEASFKAFFSGRCQAYTTDISGLAGVRNKEAKNPDDYVILPEVISKEPLGPAVRRGDDEWFSIVRWVAFALIEAEEYGITRANVDRIRAENKDPAIGRLLGSTEDTGKLLGLDRDWAYRSIKAVGNYGEIFARNVGPESVLKLPRGLNNLWNKGGILYAPPVR